MSAGDDRRIDAAEFARAAGKLRAWGMQIGTSVACCLLQARARETHADTQADTQARAHAPTRARACTHVTGTCIHTCMCIPQITTAPDPKLTFDEIDTDGGGQILFVEFCEWALSRNLLSHVRGGDEDDDGEVSGGSDREAESDGKTKARGYGESARFARGAARLGRARSIDADVGRPLSASFNSSSLEQSRSSIDHKLFRLKQMSGAAFGCYRRSIVPRFPLTAHAAWLACLC